MGRTPAPLTILVAQEWLTHERVQALVAQGHTVHVAPVADLILSPSAHYWREDMWDLLDLALTRARAKKKETKP